jgi:hypothetical protein
MPSARRVNVTCGASKKVITLSDIANSPSVKQQVCDFFAVSTSSVLQLWDEEFKDFVDVENESEIKKSSKLNISLVKEATSLQSPVQIMMSPSSPSSTGIQASGTTPRSSTQPYPPTPSSTHRWPIVTEVSIHLFSPELRKVLETGGLLL